MKKREKKANLTPEQKKERNEKLLIGGLAVIAVLLFLFGMSAYKKNDTPAVSTATTEASQDTSASTTQAATAPATTAAASVPAPDTSTSAATSSPAANPPASSEPTDEEILKAVSDAINSLKASDASFVGVKTQDIHVELTDCSAPSLTGLINKVVSLFTGEETYTYDFTNGVADDPEEKGTISSNKAIPPTEKPFTLTKEGIASAKAEKEGENTVYTIVVVAEKSTLSDPRPPHHNAAGDTLDLSAINIPTGEITKADFEYPGATVSVTVDKDGKAVKYHERLEMKGVGEGKALGITASGEMVGYIDETWDIKWK